MELKYLNTLKAILETGSFQNAARKLDYTQSTITFQMQQLEQELSVKLFEKIGRRMVLTQAGEIILTHVDTILHEVDQIVNYGKATSEMRGVLKIAFPESLLTYKLQPVLKAFRSQVNGVNLSLQVLNCYEITDALADGSIDMGIHYDVSPHSQSLVSESLASFSLALIASHDLAEEQRNFMLANQNKEIAMIDSVSIYTELFNSYLKKKNIRLSGHIVIESVEAVKRSVASNLGIAFLPSFAIEQELEQQTLCELKTELNDQTITAMVSYHKNKWLSPAMELLLRLLKENFSQ